MFLFVLLAAAGVALTLAYVFRGRTEILGAAEALPLAGGVEPPAAGFFDQVLSAAGLVFATGSESVPGVPAAQPRSGVHPEWAPFIFDAASNAGIPANILKGIVAKESNFDPMQINPESSFLLNGVSYGSNSQTGRRLLREFILAGGDVRTLRLNPSIGLAQVRVSIGRTLIGASAAALFDPATNLRAAATLLAELFRAGITLDTIDAYNVGQDLVPRNLPYRDRVAAFARQFAGDF